MLLLVSCAKSPTSENVVPTIKDETIGINPTTESTTQVDTETTTETTTQVVTSTEDVTTEVTTESTTEETSTNVATEESHTKETSKNNKKTGKGLSVKGTNLVDSSGQAVKLRGVSTHGLSWFPQYVNKDAFKYMRDEWNVNTVRLAMYTAEYNGYCTGDENNRQALIQLVDNGVSYATELGMYVIIDWHILSDNNPNMYKNQSVDFFNKMSKKYSKHTNVIYEICNEPNGGTSWEEIKSYAVEVIDTIRKNDKDAVIIVGTPNWSQYVDQAAASPIERDNIMYALHFYADTHRDDLRNKMVNAINSGLPVIVSEFGICDASGNGNVNIEEANKWMQVIKQHNVSYVIWNLSNKQESSALINSSCSKVSGWTNDELSESGKWFIGK
ncbi:MAG: glycoside hydrolase family 5 protein [Lachnospiraceae bacterium]|nr:glycoside hydrolase family 5 protein [Lachnospiraceae bacterium]